MVRRVLLGLGVFGVVFSQAQTYYWNPSPALLSSGSGEIHKAYNWTTNQNGSGSSPKSNLDDDFSSTTLGSAWNFIDSTRDVSGSPGKYSLTEVSGALKLTGRGADLWLADHGITSVYRSDITGNFDVSVKVAEQSGSYEWAKFGIVVWNDFKNIAAGGAFAVLKTKNHGFKVQYTSVTTVGNFDATDGEGVGPSTPSPPYWLRAVKNGSTFTGYYKLNLADAWILIQSCVSKGTTNANSQIGLFVTSHDVQNSASAVFDDFQGGGDIPSGLDLVFGGTPTAATDAKLTAALSAKSVNLTGYAGAFSFLSNTLTLTGDGNFNGSSTLILNGGTGTLAFTGASGTQQLTPPATQNLPAILKSGAGTLQVAVNPLKAAALTLSAGILDFNGKDLTLSGNLQVTNGTATTFANLGGRTLTVNGKASFVGTAGNLLNMNPAQAWTINAGDSLTADYASVGKSAATGSEGNPTLNSFDAGGNSRWNFILQNAPPSITRQPADLNLLVGQKAVFSLHATGSGSLAYAWRKQGDATVLGTDTLYTIAAASLPDSGAVYTCTVTNAFGTAVSREATLIVHEAPSISSGPANLTVLVGQPAGFTVTARGSAPLTYAWYRAGVAAPIAGATAASYTLNPTTKADAGASFYCIVSSPYGSATSASAKLTLNLPPAILSMPHDTLVVVGNKAVFKTSASGSAPLLFHWYRRGDTASIGTDSIYSINATSLSDNGAHFYCKVTNSFGEVTTGDAILTTVRIPSVTREPVNTTVLVGKPATFSFSVTGSDTLRYQWYKKGSATVLPGDSVFTLSAVTSADNNAIYYCVVSNAWGKDTTAEATLTVGGPSSITREPEDVMVKSGQGAVFTVGTMGTKPISYRWLLKGDTTVLSSDSVLTLDSLQKADDGKIFTVIVSNAFGKDTSREASLKVSDCDSLFKVALDTLTVDEGQPVVLDGQADCSDSYEWAPVSGPAPRILDPQVLNLAFTAPRILRDTSIVYQFSAVYASNPVAKQVTVKLREAIPDPLFTLKPPSTWNGLSPLVVRPTLTNDLALKAAKYTPPLHYQWSLSDHIADTTQGGDSLQLAHPTISGMLEISLCMDNGGLVTCATASLDIDALSISLRRTLLKETGPVAHSGTEIRWNSPARVRVWTWQGRLLFDHRGSAGEAATLPKETFRALLHHQAKLEILP